VFHASLLTPYHETEAHGVNYLEPPPDVIAGEEEYEVEEILDSKKMGRTQKLYYRVRWKGYSEAHDTWEPEDNVRHASELMNHFHQQHPTAARFCYLTKGEYTTKTPSPILHMPSNASQSSLRSSISLPANWTPYPTSTDDHKPTPVTTTISIVNPGAIAVVEAEPILVWTTTTHTQPTTTLHPPLLSATRICHPAWFDLNPEVYYSDGERQQINPSPTNTSLYTYLYAPTPISS
jgi:Chromo (CHRromatin Organisation MOdifier) domain